MNSTRGTSLIELVLAIVIVTVVALSLSQIFPKTSQNIAANKQRFIANNLAEGQLATIKSQSYSDTDSTDAALFAGSTVDCDCRVDDFSVMPSTPIQAGGATYALQTCIHSVSPNPGNAWTSACPGGADTGYKIAVVRLTWTLGSQTYFVNQQTLKSQN